MFTATRIITNQKPQKIQYLNDNSYYYNYDIQSNKEVIDNKVEDRYSFIQVHIWGRPNYKDCVKAIIRTYISVEEEFDLINSMNKVSLGLDSEQSSIGKYKEYINLLSEIKGRVKSDFNN